MEEEATAAERSELGAPLPRLVFLGTPAFACPCLERLHGSGADIALVVSQPDRRKGRGLKASPTAVKALAERLGLPVLQPDSVRDPKVIQRLLAVGADCLVLVAYGRLLPPELVTGFARGAVNVHPSLLPRHRGAAPIQRSLLAGDKVTGVSIMVMDQGLDSGPLLAQRDLAIAENEAFGSLHDRLAELGADLLVETLTRWQSGTIQPVPQDHLAATMAPPIQKEELKILWDRPAAQIAATVRAFDPWPGAYCRHEGKRIKCFQAAVASWQTEATSGEILGICDQGLLVAAADRRTVLLGELQLEGRRRMSALELARGYRLETGSLLV